VRSVNRLVGCIVMVGARTHILEHQFILAGSRYPSADGLIVVNRLTECGVTTFIEPPIDGPTDWASLMTRIPGRLVFSGVTFWTPYSQKRNRYFVVPVQGQRASAIDFSTGEGRLDNLNPVDIVCADAVSQFSEGVYLIGRYGTEEVYDIIQEEAALRLIATLGIESIPLVPLRNKFPVKGKTPKK
jgi:hypothetical protein